MITVTPLHPLFAAEVIGANLTAPRPGEIKAIVRALSRHAVLVFRGQPLTNEEQIAFSAAFGPLEETVGSMLKIHRSRFGEPRLAEVSNLAPDGSIRAADDRWRLMQRANEMWHTDSSFKPRPGKYSILCAHECPQSGGDTEFADLRAAYDRLDEKTRAEVAELRAVHSTAYSRRLMGYAEFGREAEAAFPPVLQPLVRRHPCSGRMSLYLASHASDVAGWPRERGRALLDQLTAGATAPDLVYRHHWQVGDLVMWDNRCTMHRGLPYNDCAERRDLRRTVVIDEDILAPLADDPA